MAFQVTRTAAPAVTSPSIADSLPFAKTSFEKYSCTEFLNRWDKTCNQVSCKFGKYGDKDAPIHYRWQNNPANQIPIEFIGQQDPDSSHFVADNLSWFVIPNTPDFSKLIKIQFIPNIRATSTDESVPVEIKFSGMIDQNLNLIPQVKGSDQQNVVWLNNFSFRTVINTNTIESGLLQPDDLTALCKHRDHWVDYGDAMYTRGSTAAASKLWMKNDNQETSPYLCFFRLDLKPATDKNGTSLGYYRVSISDLIWLPGNVLFGKPNIDESHNLGSAGKPLVLTSKHEHEIRQMNLPNFV